MVEVDKLLSDLVLKSNVVYRSIDVDERLREHYHRYGRMMGPFLEKAVKDLQSLGIGGNSYHILGKLLSQNYNILNPDTPRSKGIALCIIEASNELRGN